MGFDMSYQAIPEGSGLIELAREDLENGTSLSLLPIWFTSRDGGPAPGREGERDDDRIWKRCCELVAQHPDWRRRNFGPDRNWDGLHYLLSATRREEPATPADRAIDRAFGSGEIIAEHVVAGQGVPVRYLSPAEVAEIARLVEPMDADTLAVHFHPAKMEEADVYKFSADHAEESEWPWLVKTFDAFRRFFLEAARAGDGAIACKD